MIDWRLVTATKYTRSSSGDRLVSFTSIVSISGLAFGVAVLIIVLSVINGFEQELRTRVLGVLPHGILFNHNPTVDLENLRIQAISHPEIVAAAPFLEGGGLVVANGEIAGISYFGIDPDVEAEVSIIGNHFLSGSLDDLSPGKFNVAIGVNLAKKLNVTLGEKLTLVLPNAQISLAGPIPRMKRFTIKGIFKTGSDTDKNQILININDGLRINRQGSVSALRIRTVDLFNTPRILREVLAAQGEPDIQARSWMRRHGNLYAAIQTQKTTMFLLLLMLVAVAAFNVISNLIMVVNDKKGDIAILRTMGASARDILTIFILHGLMIGAVGILLGLISGVLITVNLTELYAAIDSTFALGLMKEYFIHYLPSKILFSDLLSISSVSMLICFFVTIYPAFVAARSDPIVALQHE
ncbi:MAG: lipoprotein-releasing system permease protein [Flavobacterium sp.]